MSDNAARALRVDDDLPRWDELDWVPALEYEAHERREARRFERPAAATLPRNAPGRAYGSHRRADGLAPDRVSGYQPGRRTVEITGQVQAPRRRPSQSSAAFVARPDRTALWAFLLALFLVLMAVATAHAAVI